MSNFHQNEDGRKVKVSTNPMSWTTVGKRVCALIFSALLLLYLVWDTGISSDDYPLIQFGEKVGFIGYLFPDPSELHTLVFGPVSYYFLYSLFYFLGDQYLLGYDIAKFVLTGAGIGLTYQFAKDYLPNCRAWLAAVFFILMVTHDATLYWFGALIYAFCPALLMYSHHLIRHKKYVLGATFGMLGSFSTYASPPYAFGLALIFLLERAYKKAVIFVAPGFLYVIYYLVVSHIPGVSKGRISADISPVLFSKQYLLQIGTFIDSAVGPSFWLKLWYSASAITLPSLAIAGVLFLIFLKVYREEQTGVNKTLISGLLATVLLAFAMFALTGLYPQMVFNMGNRVMVYGSMLMAFILAMLPLGRKGYAVIALCFLLSVLGLSDHWKMWNARQLEVIQNIRTSASLAQLGKGDTLLVSGEAFSKLGPFGHVEFFSETYVTGSVFSKALGRAPEYSVRSVNSRFFVDDQKLIDRKYGDKTQLGRVVYIYDAENNKLIKLRIDELDAYLSALPPDIRHWMQLLEDGWLRNAILVLMPRLKYLFERG